MYVLDCGKNSSTLYNSELDTNPSNKPPSEESLTYLSHSEVLELYKHLPRGSQLRCEYAHLGCPRKKRSKSQPFTEDQLLQLYRNLRKSGINLLLTPQQSTPRACNRSKLPKSDENDPKSICLLLEAYPEISLMKPPRNFKLSDKRRESYEWVEESNLILNNQRGENYKEDNPLYKFVLNNIEEIFNNYPILEEAFSDKGDARFKSNSKGRPANQQKGNINPKKLKLNQIYSVLCQLMNEEGELRFREKTDMLAGWAFIKRFALKQSPFHLKGGVARSNLYWHGMRHFISSKASEDFGITKKSFMSKKRGGYYDSETGKYIEPMSYCEERVFLMYRQKYCKAIKVLYIACKQALEKEHVSWTKDGKIFVTAPTPFKLDLNLSFV